MSARWNRHTLWAEHDVRRARRDRTRTLVLATAVLVMWLGLTVMSYCWRLMQGQQARAPTPQVMQPADECRVDADCALVPSLLTCCGECPATAPYEAVPRALLDELRRDTEASCAPATRLCEPPICTAELPDCHARAICHEGHCDVLAPSRCMRRW